jgi:regulatory protein
MRARSWKSTVSKKNLQASSGKALPKGEEDRSFDAAKQAAYRILSYQDRTSHELDAKLKEKGFSEEIISETIRYLQEIGALNDSRFARQWARSRTEYRHVGPIRLRRELLGKGISTEEAEAVLNQLSEEHDPVTSAEEALTRRFKDLALLEDLNHRQRAFAFLQRKGFATETILKVFRKIGKKGTP